MQGLGSRGILGIQYEATYGVLPTTDTPVIAADLTKVYIETEGFKSSRNLVASTVITGVRHSTKPLLGNIDVQGSIATELGSTLGMLIYGACGSVASAPITAETPGTALTTPVGVIDVTGQTMTVTCSVAHGLAVSDSVAVAGLTAPTELNGLTLRVIKVPSTMIFVVRIPAKVSVVFTLGSGTLKKVSTAATSYTHTFKSGGTLPSFVVEKGFTDIAQYFLYTGCKVGKMSLNLDPEAVQKISFDFTGKDEAVATSSYDTVVNDLLKNSFTGSMISSIKENASGNDLSGKVTKLDVTLDNSLDTSIYCIGGGGKRSAIPEGLSKVSGTASMIFENVALYNKAVGGTKTDLVVVIKNGTGAGTAGNEQLTIIIPELVFKQETPVISGDKGLMVTLAFEAFYENGTDATSLKLVLLNSAMTI